MLIYLLPGIGCDKRLFSRIELPGHEVKVLEWPPFPEGCTLAELAAVMRVNVDETRPHILAGVSMGGMVAEELALLTKPEKVLLISSWIGPQEWPWHVHVAKFLHLSWVVGSFTMRLTWPLKRILGPRPKEIDQLLWEMAVKQTAEKIRRGLDAILRWEGSKWKGPLVRIHGDNDHVIPKRFPVEHLVHGCEHIMVLTRPKEVSRAMLEAIGGSTT
ncbi:MAG: alpha/beta hydrolase [Flavobacteriales bacterium]